MVNHIGIKEADGIIRELYRKHDLSCVVNGWKYWMKYRNEDTITIQSVSVKWEKIGRMICVDKDELIKQGNKTIKKLKQENWKKEHGTLRQRADSIRGKFAVFKHIDYADDDVWEEYFCLKCENKAVTKHEKKECHVCEDWNGCGRDCKLSHIICDNCNLITKI